jgi:hypothetical protein
LYIRLVFCAYLRAFSQQVWLIHFQIDQSYLQKIVRILNS